MQHPGTTLSVADLFCCWYMQPPRVMVAKNQMNFRTKGSGARPALSSHLRDEVQTSCNGARPATGLLGPCVHVYLSPLQGPHSDCRGLDRSPVLAQESPICSCTLRPAGPGAAAERCACCAVKSPGTPCACCSAAIFMPSARA